METRTDTDYGPAEVRPGLQTPEQRLALVRLLAEQRAAHGYHGSRVRYLAPVPGTDLFDEVCLWSEYADTPEGAGCQAVENRVRQAAEHLRRQYQIDRIWQGTGVPPHFAAYTLDTYPVAPKTAPLVERLRAWAAGTPDRWLLLYGRYGTGKTGLAVALFRELVGAGATGLFTTAPNLLERIRATYDRDGGACSEDELLTTLRAADVLVLDDLGAERPSEWVKEKLFTLVNHRHDYHKRTLVTSNLAPAELGEHIGERTVWRIVEMADVLKVDGPNLRDRT